jgi:hypothetical protein
MIGVLGDRRGVSALEFAILAPIVLVVTTAFFEGFALHAAAIALEQGAAAAARAGATGRGDRATLVREVVTAHVCPPDGAVCYLSDSALPPGDDGVASPLRISFRAFGDPRVIDLPEPFADVAPPNGRRHPSAVARRRSGRRDVGEIFVDINGNGVWDRDLGAAGLGGPGDFVAYEVAMLQPVRHPLLRAALGPEIERRVQFTVRNEPF